MTFLSPDDYERIERLEADIKDAKADIEKFKAAHPDAAGNQDEAKTLAEKQSYLHRLEAELKAIG